MTERERLIELLRQGYEKKINLLEFEKEILADWLLEHGVIVPPVKVGDAVYTIYYVGAVPMIESNQVLEVSDCRIWVDSIYFDYDDIGKTVFLTREEAEKVLKEREENA